MIFFLQQNHHHQQQQYCGWCSAKTQHSICLLNFAHTQFIYGFCYCFHSFVCFVSLARIVCTFSKWSCVFVRKSTNLLCTTHAKHLTHCQFTLSLFLLLLTAFSQTYAHTSHTHGPYSNYDDNNNNSNHSNDDHSNGGNDDDEWWWFQMICSGRCAQRVCTRDE